MGESYVHHPNIVSDEYRQILIDKVKMLHSSHPSLGAVYYHDTSDGSSSTSLLSLGRAIGEDEAFSLLSFKAISIASENPS
jgi:hypothetical protein